MTSWLNPNGMVPVSPPIRSDASNRDAARLCAVVGQFCLDLDTGNLRYGRRDRDGKPETLETACNFLVRDFAAAMGAPVEGARANDIVTWLASDAAKARGWGEVSQHAAQGCADEGMPVIVGWHSGGPTSGHVAVLVPSLGEEGPHIAQAGVRCFSRGKLTQGFGNRLVRYFVHH